MSKYVPACFNHSKFFFFFAKCGWCDSQFDGYEGEDFKILEKLLDACILQILWIARGGYAEVLNPVNKEMEAI